MKAIPAVFLLFVTPCFASIPKAYHAVSERYGIPAVVFYSMILQESGRTLRGRYHPWPWTLNVNHKAYRYDSHQEADAALRSFMQGGNTIAVGLGQIYLPAHQHVFDDPTVLLNPRVNLEYAAITLLREFVWTAKRGTPNWWLAVGRYHAPSNEKFASIYRTQVFEKCSRISADCASYGVLQ